MMTGQLLGGATPLVAAEYQMAILWLICATTSISTYVGECLLHPKVHHLVLSITELIRQAKKLNIFIS
jgi:ABC-type iron transport system FetAB permease component